MSPDTEIVETQQVTKEMAENLEDEVSLPYEVPGVTLMSPGMWKGVDWTAREIEKGLSNTEFETQLENEGEIEQNNALFFEHDDRDARAWIGEVQNIRMDGDRLVGDLIIVDKEPAIKLEYGAKFGISAKVSGVRQGGAVKDFQYENFSLVLNPAVKTTYVNSEDEDVEYVGLQSIEVHTPSFSSTDERDWNKPNLEDFGFESWDDMSNEEKSDVGSHFIGSQTGFPADNYSDMFLPVVEPDGTLNLNALQNAKARAGQVTGLSGDQLERVTNIINKLANDNFPDSDFEGSKHMPDEDEEEQEMNENEDDDDENDIMGETTMTEEEPEPEPEASPEGEDEGQAEGSVDVESLKEELLDELKTELAEDDEEEAEDVEEEEVEEEASEDADDDEEVEDVDEADASEELSEFEKFVKEQKSENPDIRYTQIAERFEEAQKSPEEKVDERVAEVKKEMASQIDELKKQVTELSESEAEPARVSRASGQEEIKELTEEVKNQSREELRAGVMRSMLDQAGASQLYR